PLLHLAGRADALVPFATQQRNDQAQDADAGADAGAPWDAVPGATVQRAKAGILAGVGTGVATGNLTESLGTGIAGGVAGGAAAGLLLGEKKEVYAFAGVCRQRTSLAASKTADAGNKNATTTGGGVKDRDTGNSTQNQGNRSILESAQWNLKTQSYEFPFMFQIAVEGGSMSNKKARDAAAREVFMKLCPKFATGGSTL
ncbi:MAG: hypothetical protein ACK5BN_19545, partial [Planctomycetota bacterium]